MRERFVWMIFDQNTGRYCEISGDGRPIYEIDRFPAKEYVSRGAAVAAVNRYERHLGAPSAHLVIHKMRITAERVAD